MRQLTTSFTVPSPEVERVDGRPWVFRPDELRLQLRRAVIDRALGRLEAALEPAYAAAATDKRRALAELIRAFLGFVAADRTFVRLVQHETMRGSGALQEALRGR